MTPLCGALWPDAKAPDGQDVTCHLDKGHGGLWHRWDHENHVALGEPFGDGMVAWHTEMAKLISTDLVPTVVPVPLVNQLRMPNGWPITHELKPHPTHVLLRSHLPPKPERR